MALAIALTACTSGARQDSKERQRGLLAVKPECFKTPDTILIHVLIPTVYRYKDPALAKELGYERSQEDVLWQIACKLQTQECEGAQLRLAPDGKPVGVMDFGIVGGARLLSTMDSQAVIGWGPWRRFSLDLEAGSVSYAESGPSTEGRGQGHCKAIAARGD